MLTYVHRVSFTTHRSFSIEIECFIYDFIIFKNFKMAHEKKILDGFLENTSDIFKHLCIIILIFKHFYCVLIVT